MIIGLQIIALVFSFMLVYFALINFKRGEISRLELYIWSGIWMIVAFVVVFPEMLRTLSMRFLITRLFDLMVVGGFVLVIIMSAMVYTKVRRMEKKVEKYVTTDAIKNAKSKAK